MNLLWFLLVGAISGWLAGQVMKGGGFGLLGNIIVGVIGAVAGGYLFDIAGVSLGGGVLGAILTAAIGAVVVLGVIGIIKKA